MKRNGDLRMTFQCNQQWDALEPRGSHRYCASCNKLVLDFSTMTEAEIFDRLRNASSKLCARVPASKLETANPSRQGSSQLRWTCSVLASVSFLVLPQFIPQDAKAATSEVHQVQASPHSIPTQTAATDTLKRKVQLIDANSGEPIPFAIVHWKSMQGTTDLEGWVELQSESDTLHIRVGVVGYEPTTMLIDLLLRDPILVVLKQREAMFLGEVIETKRRWNPFRKWF